MKQITICLLIAVMLVSFSSCANSMPEMGQPPSSNESDVLVSERNTAVSENTNTLDCKIPNDLKAGAYLVYQ